MLQSLRHLELSRTASGDQAKNDRRPVVGRGWIGILTLVLALILPRLARAADTFADDLNRLGAFARQIEGDEKEIQELIERKRGVEDQQALDEILSELVKKHKDLASVSQDYEQLRLHIRFKHPEKNETVEHRYVHYKLKTLTEMEGAFGLDGRLDRTKAHVMAIFPLPPDDAPVAPASVFAKSRGPASEGEEIDEQDDMPGRILLRK